MIKHYITTYAENDKRYAEAWLQIKIFNFCICFWKKRIELEEPHWGGSPR